MKFLFSLLCLTGCGSDLQVTVVHPDPILVCLYDESEVVDSQMVAPNSIPEGYVRCEEESDE